MGWPGREGGGHKEQGHSEPEQGKAGWGHSGVGAGLALQPQAEQNSGFLPTGKAKWVTPAVQAADAASG